jgi:hypothetical protein
MRGNIGASPEYFGDWGGVVGLLICCGIERLTQNFDIGHNMEDAERRNEVGEGRHGLFTP